LRQEQLGRAHVKVGSAGLGAQEIEYAGQGARIHRFLLHADGHLRHPRIAVEHCITGHPDLQTHNVHLDVLPRLHAKGRNAIECCGGRCVKVLACQRQLHPVFESDGGAHGVECVVLRRGAGQVGRKADFAFGCVGANHRPGSEAATGRAINGAYAPGQQQFARIGQGQAAAKARGPDDQCRSNVLHCVKFQTVG
jgi:hypothetical protein